MKRNVILPEKSYTFSDYFKMRISTEDVVNYFGYEKENARLELPSSNRDLPVLSQLFYIIEDAL